MLFLEEGVIYLVFCSHQTNLNKDLLKMRGAKKKWQQAYRVAQFQQTKFKRMRSCRVEWHV